MTTEATPSKTRVRRGQPRVRLLCSTQGPTSGYAAAIVEPAYHWDDGSREPDDDTVVRWGPWSDAGLVARTRAMAWAAGLGLPFEE